MTIYGWIFRWFGWLIGGALILGVTTPWRDGQVDGVSRLLGVGILLLWAWSWWRIIREDRL